MARIMFLPLVAMTRICTMIGLIGTVAITGVWAQEPARPETTQGMWRAEVVRTEAPPQAQRPTVARSSPPMGEDIPSMAVENFRGPGVRVSVPPPPSHEGTLPSADQVGTTLSPGKSPARSAPKPTGVISKVKEKLAGKKSGGATVAPLRSAQSEPGYEEVADSDGVGVAVSSPPLPEAEQVLVGTGEATAANKPIVRTGEFSPLEQTVAKYQTTPVAAVKPTALSSEIQLSSRRLRDRFVAGDHDAVSREALVIRTHVCSLRSMSSLSLEKRLKVSSICRMLEDGLQILEEGQQAGDEAKVQLGLEKIYRASELLEPLDRGE